MEVEQMQHCEIRNKHRVERAIIMAAGTGTRMRPVTLDTPSRLIRVNGVRMIVYGDPGTAGKRDF